MKNTTQHLKVIFSFAMMGILFLFVSCKQEEQWIDLFNGENLDGWDIKIAGHALNENHGNTFRAEDGILKVGFEAYDTFDNKFGHIFYHQPFSHYKLRLEYRFVGEQVPGAPGWAYRNNGIMFHSQPAHTMEFNQHFPISVETQLLGGSGEGERPTLGVCTPGTSIEVEGVRIDAHCLNSSAKTYHGDKWIQMELIVYGDSLVHHIVEGDTVLTYGNILLEDSGLPLREGHIALQSESHPTEFRNIRLLNLKQP